VDGSDNGLSLRKPDTRQYVAASTGIGKSWLACALGQKACREDLSVLSYRVPRLFAALALGRGDGRYAKLLRTLAQVDLLILDDWRPETLTADQRRDLLEIVEERYDRGSLLITSQVPTASWHGISADPTLGDAILDRIVHNAYRIDLAGDSLRKQYKPRRQHNRHRGQRSPPLPTGTSRNRRRPGLLTGPGRHRLRAPPMDNRDELATSVSKLDRKHRTVR
jgi:hypothetical protein